MILMIDNYDSFTYNLVQYLGELGEDLEVYRNDKIDIAGIKKINPDHIVISPGPGRPSEAGISEKVIKIFSGKIPILGVCLGHQAIGEVFGAEVIRSERIMHGKTSLIYHDKKTIFKGINNPFTATRYHSLIVRRNSLPDCLQIIAETKEKEIMGIKHKKYSVWGVQFHPESILTEEGKKILANFLKVNHDKRG
ncbi:MAG: anthranilate/aminodeoxychorismate synthase component II [Candidatus Omnitrophica bacterium CG12_big_fil_rev_8_21_14_0_65_43_15]|uniref:Anthranilate/aminodeoxychorismate synthase component II n=1 Tax=Candidatus Taenaricola geysiri TaxID=1974752 RepID=A0A2J0LHZ1_9BACT|nr:MAG: anthranilate/aminodeoxychorismate synthase component II [Candidatus Omnitrophica bacterium CG1_02_43_210]PIW66484.1 MAG: anthranilate/aminodeoxychorismate synthase component II [Candidatus Omnitrophica bacterium CG12_big_fil_rev_8_21_14_0_65_43_15]PIW80004.1 MAG: anthranilate/aminodeoxychorismate synthase component II [Candidatus Omnitrophica bacterium CG_4_8_14_3_um_filter_43_15]PIY84783.1 MAG: anthranilate/aminodeoxychorismate synthase component II [Candidatus Omnitrophica bacterium CG